MPKKLAYVKYFSYVCNINLKQKKMFTGLERKLTEQDLLDMKFRRGIKHMDLFIQYIGDFKWLQIIKVGTNEEEIRIDMTVEEEVENIYGERNTEEYYLEPIIRKFSTHGNITKDELTSLLNILTATEQKKKEEE